MQIVDRISARPSARCHLRTECRARSDREYFGDLFEQDWGVFVIKRDKQNDAFRWFTLCCEPEDNACEQTGCYPH